jgi:hypothetical protein
MPAFVTNLTGIKVDCLTDVLLEVFTSEKSLGSFPLSMLSSSIRIKTALPFIAFSPLSSSHAVSKAVNINAIKKRFGDFTGVMDVVFIAAGLW